MVKELKKFDLLDSDDSSVSIDHAINKSRSPTNKSIDDNFIGKHDSNMEDGNLIPIEGLTMNGASAIDQSINGLTDHQNIDYRSTYYRLTDDDLRSIDQLRQRLKHQLPPTYDTDFNLYRWLKSADRVSKQKSNIDLAEKLLINHLRFRSAMKLDEIEIPSWDDNLMFTKKLLPRGFLHYMPSNNRFLWWVDYSSIDLPGICNTITSTEMLMGHFYKYEHMLRLVNEVEKKTGAMSGVHMIMDVRHYDMNPFSLMLTTNGGMTYYGQLIHYEHYPELTCPVSVINVAKWLMLPVRLIRSVMPKDFSERIRISDSNYFDNLIKDISLDDLPRALGGKNTTENLETVKAEKLDPSNYYSMRKSNEDPTPEQIVHVQVAAKKRKLIPVDCREGTKLRWWFRTDADIYFGIYFLAEGEKIATEKEQNKKDILDKLEMVHPFFRLLTKIIPERGEHLCEKRGTYYLVFCNKISWIYRRNIQVKIDIDDQTYDRRRVLERAYSVH